MEKAQGSTQRRITDDLEALIETLPAHIEERLRQLDDRDNLLEIVMDLGRLPEARFPAREVTLSESELSSEDLEHVVARIGEFGEDNRAGIERTLHRISAIRNRKQRIVGLTCRIGRAVYGTIGIIRDIVESGRSILLLGRPGVGKTTMLREVGRVLADDLGKRVVIVDTSNEIAGDGDIPHPAIGHARRMQVPTPALQHAVMIEAVENHMPEVIIIDEIGTELEAVAARTIAERGVQLVATAHGNTLENLILNPTLADLIGGIQSVTLGDEEARRRGTQKSILERKAPPTFDVVVEIQSWESVAVHSSVAFTVDSILRGQPTPAELRYFDASGQVQREAAQHVHPIARQHEPARDLRPPAPRAARAEEEFVAQPVQPRSAATRVTRIYPYGINQNRLEQAIREMRLPVAVTRDVSNADAVITLRNYYRRHPVPIRDAESANVPVFVLKNNTVMQMAQCLASLYDLDVPPDPIQQAMEETRAAIDQVLEQSTAIDLSPQNAYVRRLQHQMAEQFNLSSRSRGKEPHRRVRIYRDEG